MAAGRSSSGGPQNRLLPAPLRLKQLSLIRSRPKPPKLMPLNLPNRLTAKHSRHPGRGVALACNRGALWGSFPWVDSTTTVRGFRSHHKPGSRPGAQQLAIHVRRTGQRGVQPLRGTHRYLLQPAGSSRFPHRARWFAHRLPLGVTSITAHLRPGPALSLRGARSGDRQPGQYSLIPYAGLRVINAQLGVNRRAAQQRSRAGQGGSSGRESLDAPGAAP